MSVPPPNITGLTELSQQDLKDPALSLLNLQFKNSAQAVGNVHAYGQQTRALLDALREQVKVLAEQVAALGQPSAQAAARASGSSLKGQAQQSVNTVNALVGQNTPIIPVSKGGTGQKSLTQHGVVLGEGTGKVSVIAPGPAGTVLTSTGTTSDPDFEDAQLLGASGLGNGAAANLQAPAKGTGGGPASLTVAGFVQIKVNGGSVWMPYFS